MCSVPSMDEVWLAVKGLNSSSAPGIDGYTGVFYVTCWEIIKHDVLSAVQDFFQDHYQSH